MNAAGGVWDLDLNCEPGLCWSKVEMPEIGRAHV